MLADECGRRYCGNLPVERDCIEKLFLFLGDVGEDFTEHSIVRIRQRDNCRTDCLHCAGTLIRRVRECFIECLLDIKCVSLEEIIDGSGLLLCDEFPCLSEVSDYERDIHITRNRFQFKHIRASVKGMIRRKEHLLHHMPFAAGIDEIAVCGFLDVTAKNGLHIFFRIFRNLLEFVDCDDAGFVRIVQIFKNLFENKFRPFDIPQFDAESRLPRHRVETELPAD